MAKTKLGPSAVLLPLPVLLVGSRGRDTRPNFATIAWAGICNSEPPMLGVGIRKSRYSHKLITETNVFSVNVPSPEQAKETDFCGMNSGRKVDKAGLCKFTVYYGGLEHAPLIRECPMNIECTVEQVVELPTHDYFIGRITEVHVDEDLAVDQRKENVKVSPLVFMGTHYARAVGDLGRAFHVGLNIRDGV